MADPYAGRRYSDRTGKGLYEDQVEGLSSGLRQLFGGGVSPRMTEGQIPAQSPKTVRAALGNPSPTPPVSGMQERTFGAQGAASGSAPVEPQGLRRGGVSNIGDASEGLNRMARANAIRQEQLDASGGPKVAVIGNSDAAERERKSLMSEVARLSQGGRAGRNKAAALVSAFEAGQRGETDAARLAAQEREAAMRNALGEKQIAESATDRRERLGLDREKFEFDKQPKPMSEIDKVRLAEAQYGLSKARADAAAAAADRAGVSPEDRTRLFQNFGGNGGLTDLSPDRMDGAIAQQAIGLRANDLANQYSIGGATSNAFFDPVSEDEYNWGDMRFWDDDPNTPNAWQTLTSTKGDVVVGADGRRLNAAGLRKATKDIDLLGRLTKPRN